MQRGSCGLNLEGVPGRFRYPIFFFRAYLKMGRFGLHSLACAVIPDEFSMKPDDKSANLRNAPRHNLRLGYSRDVLNQNVVREFLERQALLMRVFADAVTKATADMRQFAEWARLLHYQQRARHAAKQFRRVTEWKQQS